MQHITKLLWIFGINMIHLLIYLFIVSNAYTYINYYMTTFASDIHINIYSKDFEK